MSDAIFPWHLDIWRGLFAARDRLPHALLLHGPEGGGKARFAAALAARLLCEQPESTGFACGQCQACLWLGAGNHPDFRQVLPESEEALDDGEGGDEKGSESAGDKKKRSTQIRIEQVRALSDFMVVGTHRQGLRVVLLRPAEAMNVPTANSLLKMLEEPASDSLFILVSHNLNQLLPTLRSRCRLVHFGKPDARLSQAWLDQEQVKDSRALLALAGGMPLLAQRLAQGQLPARHKRFLAAVADPGGEDPLRLAAELEAWLGRGKAADSEVDMPALVDWLQKWVLDMARVASGIEPIFHPDARSALVSLGQKTSLPALFACYNDLQRARAVARHPLNSRLFLEDMLFRYGRLFTGERSRPSLQSV